MKIIKEKNITLKNSGTKDFLVDAFYPEISEQLPLVIFVHGYKGYKDWGTWNLMAESFAKAGFFFVKFNFSHNGTTLENPLEFDDLESFGLNNYSKELSDLEVVISHFSNHPKVDTSKITLIGHSRGGGISIIKASEDPRIQKLITLASVSTLNRFPKGKNFEAWKNNGVFHVLNGRTGQKMPHQFQFWEDFEVNKMRFDIQETTQKIKISSLIIHGTNDEAVGFEHAENLHRWIKKSELFAIENAQHTFGGKEPWTETKLPPDLQKAIDKMIRFIKK